MGYYTDRDEVSSSVTTENFISNCVRDTCSEYFLQQGVSEGLFLSFMYDSAGM